MERDKGIEPSYPAWKAGALADVLIPHRKGGALRGMPREDRNLKKGEKIFFFSLYLYYTKIFLKNQLICECTNDNILDMPHCGQDMAHNAIPIHAIF